MNEEQEVIVDAPVEEVVTTQEDIISEVTEEVAVTENTDEVVEPDFETTDEAYAVQETVEVAE